ncbi:fimbrial protein [Pseudomonas marginalis]|uniref:fimbrial protein n=1 Tax=Pseudomonas marginalis TaxID=298 RepID=UPI003BA3406A
MINGIIQSNGCAVSAVSQNVTVTLGTIAQKQFNKVGSAFGKRQFSIYLERCGSAATGVKTSFDGTVHPDNNDLLALTDNGAGTATGLGIEILDYRGVLLPLLNVTEHYFPITPSAPITELVFYAQYRSTGTVTSGTADAVATFYLEYE